MNEKATYVLAILAAAAAFAASGGISASEIAVKAEEAQAQAPARQLGVDAQIPFANAGGIRDWQPDGTQALYVQDAQGRWYHATLMGPCPDLPFTEKLAFLTRGTDRLDKFSTVAVRGQHCQFSALVSSAPPPAKAKQEKVKAAS